MPTVPQPPSNEQFRRTVADVFGDRDATPTAASPSDWPHAVAQVGDALCEKLRLAAPSARLSKALELVLAQAVTLHADGSASVLSGKQTYTLAPHCPCPDAKNRSEMCKHALAVELHRRALAVLDGTAHAPAPAVAPAPAPPAPPTSAAWQVHEAPTSACFRFRLGQGELTYTFRGVNDLEVLDRIHEHLPFLQAIVDGWEQRAAERAAARDAAQAQAPQAPAPTDMQALIQHAVFQALAAQSHGAGASNGHANGHTPASPPRCPTHGALRESTKAPGTWFSRRSWRMARSVRRRRNGTTQAPLQRGGAAAGGQTMESFRVERYGNTRFFAVYDATHALVCVCVSRRGAEEVARRLQALDDAQRWVDANGPAHDVTTPAVWVEPAPWLL